MVATATMQADGSLTVGGGASILGECGDASTYANRDVRNPEVSPDGETVVFAMRTSASAPLSIYTVGIGGGACTRLTDPEPDDDGITGIVCRSFMQPLVCFLNNAGDPG